MEMRKRYSMEEGLGYGGEFCGQMLYSQSEASGMKQQRQELDSGAESWPLSQLR